MGSIFTELYAEECRLLQLNPGARRRLSIWLVLAARYRHFGHIIIFSLQRFMTYRRSAELPSWPMRCSINRLGLLTSDLCLSQPPPALPHHLNLVPCTKLEGSKHLLISREIQTRAGFIDGMSLNFFILFPC